MKSFFFFIFLVFSFTLNALELQSGDFILISFNCYECRVIEAETNSLFSHSGVVIKGAKNEIFVAQSLTTVHLSSLQDFLKNKTPGTKASVFRSFELENRLNSQEKEQNMRDVFAQKFLGLPFDSKYLWNNFDDQGRELLYCSEFVAKFLDYFLSTPSILFPLSYSKNYSYWFKYFDGQIPEGEIGNSPASLAKDSRFHLVGILN
jgi:hypothetical protein